MADHSSAEALAYLRIFADQLREMTLGAEVVADSFPAKDAPELWAAYQRISAAIGGVATMAEQYLGHESIRQLSNESAAANTALLFANSFSD